jgi:hypothetical protein
MALREKKPADSWLAIPYRKVYGRATKPDAKRSGAAPRTDGPAIGRTGPPNRRRQDAGVAPKDGAGNRVQGVPPESAAASVAGGPAAAKAALDERKRLSFLAQNEAGARACAAYQQEKLQAAASFRPLQLPSNHDPPAGKILRRFKM